MAKFPVSVIVPVYATTEQDLKWLHACLMSCYMQVDDIVLVDDGSPANVAHIASMFDIQAIFSEHVGKSAARNMAVRAARNELIYPVDADDWLAHNAMHVLYEAWKGIPVYSNIYKVEEGVPKEFPLRAFDCDALVRKSIASVNVLHSKEQWEAIGGWDEDLAYFEDWAYNTKLLWSFCGIRVTEYLVYYRQHSRQSTALMHGTEQEQKYKQMLVSRNQAYIERTTSMACCNKKRRPNQGTRTNRTIPQPAFQSLAAARSTTPVSEASVVIAKADYDKLGQLAPNHVWARYMSSPGMGPHERRGMRSRKKYRTMYGQVVQVDKRDSVTVEQLRQGARNCGFVTLQVRAAPKPTAAQPPEQVIVNNVIQQAAQQPKDTEILRQPISKRVTRTPVTMVAPIANEAQQIIDDLQDMRIADLREIMADVGDVSVAQAVLEAEQAGKNRVGAVKMLEKKVRQLS